MMVNLQEKLVSLSEYGTQFEVAKGMFVIRLKYPADWSVIQPSDDVVKMYKDEAEVGVYYYTMSIASELPLLFEAIDETIGYNKEMEEKVELFKETLEKLRGIFAEESIEVLKTLEFRMKKKKARQSKVKEEETLQTEEQENEEAEETSTYCDEMPQTEDLTPQTENVRENEPETPNTALDDKIDAVIKKKNKQKN